MLSCDCEQRTANTMGDAMPTLSAGKATLPPETGSNASAAASTCCSTPGRNGDGGGGGSSSDAAAAAVINSAKHADLEPTTIFVKVERLRRLHRSDELVYTVRRGEDGTFGLGLSEDNEIVAFYHEQNTDVLRLGDQVRSVGDVPLVRERLATLLQRHFPDDETVQLHISRSSEQAQKRGGDVVATIELRTADGEDLDDWSSEIWALRTDAVWGTFWTLPILPRARTIWFGVHESNLFTEPLIGCVEIPIGSLVKEQLDCRWCASLRPTAMASASTTRARLPARARSSSSARVQLLHACRSALHPATAAGWQVLASIRGRTSDFSRDRGRDPADDAPLLLERIHLPRSRCFQRD